jgi:hypothetical protein
VKVVEEDDKRGKRKRVAEEGDYEQRIETTGARSLCERWSGI